jgi:hypothetical protein
VGKLYKGDAEEFVYTVLFVGLAVDVILVWSFFFSLPPHTFWTVVSRDNGSTIPFSFICSCDLEFIPEARIFQVHCS